MGFKIIAATVSIILGNVGLAPILVHTGNFDLTVSQNYLSGHGTNNSNNSMPQNPNAKLPSKVSSSIPDDATVVSENLAVTADGTVKDLATGKRVTDEQLVGSESKPADPLAKTGGENFIPVEAQEVKQAVQQAQDADDANEQNSAQDTHSAQNKTASYIRTNGATQGNVRSAALMNNQYGAYWGSYNGYPAFFEYNGNPYIQNAKGVVDVSEWQGTIDWATAKAHGVEGAIIRISYGWGNGYDKQALRNIRECIRFGIPFGVYSYSYAYDTNTARAEANDIVSLLRQAGVSPSALSYPVFYDLEKWTWDGHSVPTNPDTYAAIVDTWMNIVRGAGYNSKVYSYTSYLDTSLNRTSIRNQVEWVASYGARTGFDIAGNNRGWQYSSAGRINGISGNVDINAFGVATLPVPEYNGVKLNQLGNLSTDIVEGDYHIVSVINNRYLDVFADSKSALAPIDVYPYTSGKNQVFHIKPVAQGQYQITSVSSNLTIDAAGPSYLNGTKIIQYPDTRGANQRWAFYRTSTGTYIIASIYAGSRNKVIDIPNGKADSGTLVNLWAANGGINQQFRLEHVSSSMQQKDGWVVENGRRYRYQNGVKLRNQEFCDPATGKWYWLGNDGAMATGWVNLPDGRRVYYDLNSGTMLYGEAHIDGYWYYFRTTDGAMVRGITYVQSDGGKWVYYNTSTGRMMYGEQYVNYDAEHTGWYLFNQGNGVMQYGDIYLMSGEKWVRYDQYTGIMVKGLQRYDHSWYYFDPSTGKMAHGWAYVPEWRNYHYFDIFTGRG